MDESTSMQTPEDALSYIAPIGYTGYADCGYCRKERSGQLEKRFSYYAEATSLSPAFYQALLDRAWRRSGTLLYRPNPKNSCCPHYTLRLDAVAFKPTKDQRQAINRFNRYVVGDGYATEAARLYPRSREEVRRRDTVFDLVERVHEAESALLKTPPEPAHKLVITLESNAFSEEKYAVFENYQRLVHKEPPSRVSRAGFTNFLCNSPVRRGTVTDPDGRQRELGSFHQCYRLDGVLVAVGVLDLLPDGVSAVYFLYHESVHKHSPGKMGALREIALARELGYKWWYPGYYIHSCPKMRYKMDYSPQHVLDPETLTWDLLDERVMAEFDAKHYVSMSRKVRKDRQARERAEWGFTYIPGTEMQETESVNSEEDDEDTVLLTSNFPGIPTIREMEEVDLDSIRLCLDKGIYHAKDLVGWDHQKITDWKSAKGKLAELAAAVGADLLDQICIDYRSSRASSP